jgi:hypothetical protein
MRVLSGKLREFKVDVGIGQYGSTRYTHSIKVEGVNLRYISGKRVFFIVGHEYVFIVANKIGLIYYYAKKKDISLLRDGIKKRLFLLLSLSITVFSLLAYWVLYIQPEGWLMSIVSGGFVGFLFMRYLIDFVNINRELYIIQKK